MPKKFRLPYGKGGYQEITLEEKNFMGTLERNKDIWQLGGETLAAALSNPVGTASFKNIMLAVEKIAIVTSDLARPCPSKKILPPVLKELAQAGVKEEEVTIILITGNHRLSSAIQKCTTAPFKNAPLSFLTR